MSGFLTPFFFASFALTIALTPLMIRLARRVDFLGSYPPGDMALGELRGPMREETEQWLNRISMGLTTQHATAAEAHNRLMLTKAFDLSARTKREVKLPITSE